MVDVTVYFDNQVDFQTATVPSENTLSPKEYTVVDVLSTTGENVISDIMKESVSGKEIG